MRRFMQLEENMIIGKMVIYTSSDSAKRDIARTCIYPYGARILSINEVNFGPEDSEQEIVLKVASKVSDKDIGVFEKRIQLPRGQVYDVFPAENFDPKLFYI